jgi:hypothetical protein
VSAATRGCGVRCMFARLPATSFPRSHPPLPWHATCRWRRVARRQFVPAFGQYTLSLGASSRDLRDAVTVQFDQVLSGAAGKQPSGGGGGGSGAAAAVVVVVVVLAAVVGAAVLVATRSQIGGGASGGVLGRLSDTIGRWCGRKTVHSYSIAADDNDDEMAMVE